MCKSVCDENVLVQEHLSRLMTKPTKWHVRPANTQIRLGSLIRVFTVRMKKAWVLSYPLSAQQRHWSDWVDSQADLSLRWAHMLFVGFVMRRLIFIQQHYPHSKNLSATSFSTDKQTLHRMVVHLHTGGKYELKEESYQGIFLWTPLYFTTKFVRTETYWCHEFNKCKFVWLL